MKYSILAAVILALPLCAQLPKPGGTSTGGGGGVAAQQHGITIPVNGTPIITGTSNVGLPANLNFACTITTAQIVGNASGSITVDIWKKAAAIPSSADKISASAPVTLSSAQVNQSSSLTGWTTAIASGDILWASVATVDGALAGVTVQLWCQ
jgi:hypothetical protein